MACEGALEWYHKHYAAKMYEDADNALHSAKMYCKAAKMQAIAAEKMSTGLCAALEWADKCPGESTRRRTVRTRSRSRRNSRK